MSSTITTKEGRDALVSMIQKDKPEGWALALESYNKSEGIRDVINNLCKAYNLLPMLMHIDDVKDFYDVTDDEAYEILAEAFESHRVVGAVCNAIDYICERDEIDEVVS